MNDTGPTKESSAPVNRHSVLAAASLVFGLMLVVGSVPGIICGHLAKSRLKRDPLLKGRGMATAGLVLSYFALILFAGWAATANMLSGGSGPKIVLRESPEAVKALEPRIVDTMNTSLPASKSAHNVQGQELTSGPFNSRTWLSTWQGGFITMDMKVLPDKPMTLNCTYWGSEEAPRKFDIIIAGKLIATQELDYNMLGHFFDIEYKIPEEITRGKTEVAIEFRGYPGAIAGALFGVAILKE